MDKYEYQIRADEIKALITEGEFAEAVKIADTIDWRRVRSVMMLCTISDLYKINRRYRESKDIMLLAYEKHPTARSIVYSLCELSIKMEEYVQAIEYYKEFVQIAPKDTGRYILQYRLYEAQDVSLEERIEVLKEFKKHDYREKWAYELAYLYHRIGLATQCVEECDEMFIMFGEGKYIIKALELKALHTPLNAEQQVKYDEWIRMRKAGEDPTEDRLPEEDEDDIDSIQGDTRVAGKVRHTSEEAIADEQEISAVPTMELPEVKTVDVGQYNTINLQMALAESMKEILSDEEEDSEGDEALFVPENTYSGENGQLIEEQITQQETLYEDEEVSEEDEGEASDEEMPDDGISQDEEEDEEDDGQRSLAESLIAPLLEETVELPKPAEVEEQLKEAPVIAFPGKAVSEADESRSVSDRNSVQSNKKLSMDTDDLQEISAQIAKEDTASYDAQQILEQMKQDAVQPQRQEAAFAPDRIPGARTGVLTPLNTKPSKFDNILSQEYDGQISLVVPETERVEKQITGQLSIDDIMAEWEQVKKTNEEKRMEDVRQHIMAQTGRLFANFDEATKNGLLEELEKAFMAAIMKESGKKPKVKKVIIPEDEEPVSEKTIEKPAEKEKLVQEEELQETQEEETVVEEEAAEEEPVRERAGKRGPKRPPHRKPKPVEEPVEETGPKVRDLTTEEQELFGQFVHHRKSRKQLVNVLDNMSLASCTGNVLVSGEEKDMALDLAKALIREMQYNDGNFSGKVAKIEGPVLNKKDVAATFGRLDNGALIIDRPSKLRPETVSKMIKFLEKDNMGLLLIMVDTKQNINQLLSDHAALSNNFNLRVDIEPLDNESLVAYAKQYAEEMEYAIDEFGILALHTRIADRQTSDHEVSLAEVRELVDEAISYANKKTPGHFMDVLLAKRYDEDDMIILREKDFMHY